MERWEKKTGVVLNLGRVFSSMELGWRIVVFRPGKKRKGKQER
jgi:hypothetical protein